MSFVEEEPPIVRTGRCDLNTFIDTTDIENRREHAYGTDPYYPVAQRQDYYNIRQGEPVCRRRLVSESPFDSRLMTFTTLCGVGAEEKRQFQGKENLIREAIESKYDIIGIAAKENNHAMHAADQGFITAVAGLISCDILDNSQGPYSPGMYVRAELPPPNIEGSTHTQGGIPLDKYTWRLVPEKNTTPVGEQWMNHLYGSIYEAEEWQRILKSNDLEYYRWDAVTRATQDSVLTSGLLTVRALLKAGLIQLPNLGTANEFPVLPDVDNMGSGGMSVTLDEELKTAIAENNHDQFIARLAEGLSITDDKECGVYYSQMYQQQYYDALRLYILRTIIHDGADVNKEVGSGAARDADGSLLPTSMGRFVDKQINHIRKFFSAGLQCIDSHLSKRMGKVVSAGSRTKRFNMIIERTCT